MNIELTEEEKKAMRVLKRAAKIWSDSLWLFTNGTICIMRKGENGEHVTNRFGGMDQDYIVETIEGIGSDGGDW